MHKSYRFDIRGLIYLFADFGADIFAYGRFPVIKLDNFGRKGLFDIFTDFGSQFVPGVFFQNINGAYLQIFQLPFFIQDSADKQAAIIRNPLAVFNQLRIQIGYLVAVYAQVAGRNFADDFGAAVQQPDDVSVSDDDHVADSEFFGITFLFANVAFVSVHGNNRLGLEDFKHFLMSSRQPWPEV